MDQFKSESNDQKFVLKSDFAKRSSNPTSVAQVQTSMHEAADIEESLKIINSTRRFLQNSSQQAGIDQVLTPTVAISNEMSHENIIHQTMQTNKSAIELAVHH